MSFSPPTTQRLSRCALYDTHATKHMYNTSTERRFAARVYYEGIIPEKRSIFYASPSALVEGRDGPSPNAYLFTSGVVVVAPASARVVFGRAYAVLRLSFPTPPPNASLCASQTAPPRSGAAQARTRPSAETLSPRAASRSAPSRSRETREASCAAASGHRRQSRRALVRSPYRFRARGVPRAAVFVFTRLAQRASFSRLSTRAASSSASRASRRVPATRPAAPGARGDALAALVGVGRPVAFEPSCALARRARAAGNATAGTAGDSRPPSSLGGGRLRHSVVPG